MNASLRYPLVCWSIDERHVCVVIDGQRHWIEVTEDDGRDDAFCMIDGRRYHVGGDYAYPV